MASLTKPRIVFDEGVRHKAIKLKHKDGVPNHEARNLPKEGYYVIGYVSDDGQTLYMYDSFGQKNRITLLELPNVVVEVLDNDK